MVRVKHILWLFLVSWMLIACQQEKHDRSGDDTNSLLFIEDSMEANPRFVRQKIDDGMKKAPDSLTYYEYMSRLGKFFVLSSSPDSMSLYINPVVAFAEHQPESPRRNSLLAYAYNCQAGNYHNFHKKREDVITLYHKAYELLRNSDSPKLMPDVCANLGDAYVFDNNLPQAALWYRKALFIADSLQMPKEQTASLYMGLGRIYLLLEDYEATVKCYQQTEKYFSDLSLNLQAYFLNNYGNYYYYTKDYHTSLKKFLMLMKLLEKHDKHETFSMYLCKLNLADVYLNLNQLDLSEKYLDEAENYMRKNADESAIYYCNTIRIGLAVKKKDWSAVSRILAGEKSEDQMDFSLRQIRHQYLGEYYEAKGDYRLAYHIMKADDLMQDSLAHNRTHMRSVDIMQRFAQDTLQLHHRIAIEHKNVEIQQARSFIYLIVGILLVLILSAALFVVRYRRKQEATKLNIMNLKLNNARNRISPHFVFNVLNNKIVKSDKEEANELLELTKLIRANLDMSLQMQTSLRKELEFVRQYVLVESRLIEDDFKFDVQIDETIDLDKVMIPSMFVQILAENAFVHGLKGWEGEKRLTIQVQKGQKEEVRITVEDNGPGFDATKMSLQHRTGLNIIRQTIAIVNERNKNKIIFQMHNKVDADGKILGCQCTFFIPINIKY